MFAANGCQETDMTAIFLLICACNFSGGSKPRFATTSNRFVGGPSVSAAPPLVEIYQEYDIDKMEDRAEKFSDVHTLKRRARRYYFNLGIQAYQT